MFEFIHFLHCGCLDVAGSYSCPIAWIMMAVTIALAVAGAVKNSKTETHSSTA
jgi:hypothetical protein